MFFFSSRTVKGIIYRWEVLVEFVFRTNFIVRLHKIVDINNGRAKTIQNETLCAVRERSLSASDLLFCPRRCRASRILWFL